MERLNRFTVRRLGPAVRPAGSAWSALSRFMVWRLGPAVRPVGSAWSG
jgi:hypothetical protein